MTRLRARLRRDGDGGTTMAETVCAIFILGIVLAMVQGMVITANKTRGSMAARVDTGNEAKSAIDALTRNLRTAVLPQQVSGTCSNCPSVAFVQGTPTSVQFYANNNSDQTRLGPSKMTYSLSNGNLTETVQLPDPHDPTIYTYTYCTPSTTCKTTSRIVARGITTSKMFTYYNKGGTELTGSSLTAAQLSQVDSIDVVVPAKAAGQTTTLVQRVTLPNADTVADITATATP